MPELQEALPGEIPAHRALLRLRTIVGYIDESDRLLLPGLRTLHEAPSPWRVLLRTAVSDFLSSLIFLRSPDSVFMRSGEL
jgi:hypothetical protein